MFVRAGSILRFGDAVEDMDEPQGPKKIRIDPGMDATFNLYRDEGATYNYGGITVLHWGDANSRFSHTGAKAWTAPDDERVKIIHPSNNN